MALPIYKRVNWGSVVKNPPANAGVVGQQDLLEEEMASQASILGNSMDRGAWRATVHGVVKSRTRLKPLSMHARSRRGTSTCKHCSAAVKGPRSQVCLRLTPEMYYRSAERMHSRILRGKPSETGRIHVPLFSVLPLPLGGSCRVNSFHSNTNAVTHERCPGKLMRDPAPWGVTGTWTWKTLFLGCNRIMDS